MKTREEVRAHALQETLKYYFCNVGEDTWPDDPMAMLENDQLEDGDKVLDVYQPFEYWSVEDVCDEVVTMAEAFERAMLWAQGKEMMYCEYQQGDACGHHDNEQCNIQGTCCNACPNLCICSVSMCPFIER